MTFQLFTHLTPEEVLEQAEQYFRENTGLAVQEKADNRIEYSGAIGIAKIAAFKEHGHTTVHVETDRGVGFDVTDQALRFLYSLPHI